MVLFLGSCEGLWGWPFPRRPQDCSTHKPRSLHWWRNRVVGEFMLWHHHHWHKKRAKIVLLKFNSIFNSCICLRGKKNSPKQHNKFKTGTVMCPFHRFTQASWARNCVCLSFSLPFLIISLALYRFSFYSYFQFCTKNWSFTWTYSDGPSATFR